LNYIEKLLSLPLLLLLLLLQEVLETNDPETLDLSKKIGTKEKH
jgi:hypothetical protein